MLDLPRSFIPNSKLFCQWWLLLKVGALWMPKLFLQSNTFLLRIFHAILWRGKMCLWRLPGTTENLPSLILERGHLESKQLPSMCCQCFLPWWCPAEKPLLNLLVIFVSRRILAALSFSASICVDVRDANFGVHPCIQTAARHFLIFICARACRGTEAMRRSIRVGCTWCMQWKWKWKWWNAYQHDFIKPRAFCDQVAWCYTKTWALAALVNLKVKHCQSCQNLLNLVPLPSWSHGNPDACHVDWKETTLTCDLSREYSHCFASPPHPGLEKPRSWIFCWLTLLVSQGVELIFDTRIDLIPKTTFAWQKTSRSMSSLVTKLSFRGIRGDDSKA